MGDVSKWLEQLGLGRYAEAFAENDVDFRALPELTEDDLKVLGEIGRASCRERV